MYKKLKKGFTLVELIVVMAIIAILSTVAVVSYSAIVKKAEQSKAQTEFNQVVNVIKVEAANSTTIAILAAVLIPTFSGVIEKANLSSATQAGRNAYIEAKVEVLDDGEIEDKETVYLTKDGTVLKKSGTKYYSKLVMTTDEIPAVDAVDNQKSVEGTLEWTFIFDQNNGATIASVSYGSKYNFSVVGGVYSCEKGN